jgi:hypothetical protein
MFGTYKYRYLYRKVLRGMGAKLYMGYTSLSAERA